MQNKKQNFEAFQNAVDAVGIFAIKDLEKLLENTDLSSFTEQELKLAREVSDRILYLKNKCH